MKNRLFQIWFALRCGIANREFVPILEQYGSPYDVFNADEAELDRLTCSERLKNALMDKSLDESYRILDFCRSHQVGILFWQDEEYPSSLRALRDAPVLLYYRGHLPDFAHLLCISMVGTRKMSEYGKRMAYKIGYELGAAHTVLISGMALGIDSVSAAGALAAGGHTVAVLGCGIDVVYPREHAKLYDAILKNGVVMTEYPPSTPPDGRHFPVRNRIISGLGQGTVVVEANLSSGALITAKTAILQGRDIYAVPGNVGDPNTIGTNQLIRDGAAVVLCARDILENYTFLYRDAVDMARLTRAETRSDLNEELLNELGVCARTWGDSRRTTVSEGQAEGASPRSASAVPAGESTGRNRTSSAPAAQTEQMKAEKSAPAAQRPVERPSHRRKTELKGRETVSVPAQETVGDNSERIVASLTQTQRGIFEALPLDRAVPTDYLVREGFAMSDVMASLTILEIKGLVVSLPGGLYSRK